MISKLIKKDNYDLHVYKTDKFKTIKLVLSLTYDKKDDEYLVDLFRELLLLTSKHYKTKRERLIKEEELYNSFYSISGRENGRMSSLLFGIEFINPKLVHDDYAEQVIKYLFDVSNNPVFDNSKLDYLKDKLRLDSAYRKEEPSIYAEYKAFSLFHDNPIDKPNFILDDDVIDSITMDEIENKYKEILNNSNVDIFLLGDVDDKYIDYIDKYNVFKSVNKTFEYQIEAARRDEVKIVTETRKDINQAQIYMMYNIPKMNYEDFMKMYIYSVILGGSGLTSRLYQKLRTEYQLCYNIGVYNKMDTSMFAIVTSVDNNNVDKAIELINECIDGMKEITDEEIENEKFKVNSNKDTIYDSLRSIFIRDYFEILVHRYSIDKEKEIVDSITKEDVLSMNSNFKPIYILRGE